MLLRTHVHSTSTRRHAEFIRQAVPTAYEDGVAEGSRLARAVAGGQPVASEEAATTEVGGAGDQGALAVVQARPLRVRRRRLRPHWGTMAPPLWNFTCPWYPLAGLAPVSQRRMKESPGSPQMLICEVT